MDDELVPVVEAERLRRDDDQREPDQRAEVDEVGREERAPDQDRHGGREHVGEGQ